MNWYTNLYYPNGEVNKDLVSIESISGEFNMNATDWFNPKLQLRAKPKGFVPVNLDMAGEWNEDSLENKYFKFYYRNKNGVYQLTNDYQKLNSLNSIINYFECAEYYGDGKLICKLYDYDDGINNPDKIGLDGIDNYDYIGMLYKDIKVGDIIYGNEGDTVSNYRNHQDFHTELSLASDKWVSTYESYLTPPVPYQIINLGVGSTVYSRRIPPQCTAQVIHKPLVKVQGSFWRNNRGNGYTQGRAGGDACPLIIPRATMLLLKIHLVTRRKPRVHPMRTRHHDCSATNEKSRTAADGYESQSHNA